MDITTIDSGLLLVALAAIAVGSLVKGVTGVGLPLLAVPAIAAFTSVEEAVVLMIIPTFGSNLWLVVNYRRFAALLAAHKAFLIAGFLGGILGTFGLVAIDDRWLKLTLAVWLAVYLIQFIFGNILRSLFQAKGPMSAAVGVTAGAIQGATGISAHIVAPYFHGRKLEPSACAFLIACAFLTFSGAQLATASSTQLFTPERLVIGIIALLPTLLFTQAGIRLASEVSAAFFQKILFALFILMEIKLIADVFGWKFG